MIERLLAGEAALARGDLDAAERLFAQVADADPRNAIAIVGRARVARVRGDSHEARALADRALALDPAEAAARRLLLELDGPSTAAQKPRPPAGDAPHAARRRSGWRGWLGRLFRRS